MRQHELVWVRDGRDKTRLLMDRIYEGATDPNVREVAQLLVRGTDRNAHAERLERLHRFVRDSVDYHREPIEMFQRAGLTLEVGGDCDCLVILLGSLVWALRYPWRVRPVGDELDPEHYSLLVGYPAGDSPHGDDFTTWIHAEPSAAAAFGESSEAAGRRRAVL